MNEPKKKLSGAQRRRIAREKALLRATPDALARPLAPEHGPPVPLDAMTTVSAVRRELFRVYGQMRSGEITADKGGKLIQALQLGANLVRHEEELEQKAAMLEAAAKLAADRSAGALLTHVAAIDYEGAVDGEISSTPAQVPS